MSVRGFQVVLCALALGVLSLLAVQVMVRPAPPADADVPPEVRDLADALGSPMELNWLVAQLARDGQRHLSPAQRSRIVAELEASVQWTGKMRSWWVQAEWWMRQALTPEQKGEVRSIVCKREITAVPRGQCPMSEKLFVLMKERSGLDFLNMPLDELIRLATVEPFADPDPGAQNLNPEDFAYGLLGLEATSRLAITKRQAIQILPYIRLQNDLYQGHEAEKRRILTVLDRPQREWVKKLHVQVSTSRRVPECTAEEALVALGAGGTGAPGAVPSTGASVNVPQRVVVPPTVPR